MKKSNINRINNTIEFSVKKIIILIKEKENKIVNLNENTRDNNNQNTAGNKNEINDNKGKNNKIN